MRHRRGPRPASTALLLVAAVALAFPAFAHHSFAAYDVVNTRTLKGTLEMLQWSNPHVTLKMLVQPDAGGAAQEWNLVTSGPAILKRFGWTRSSLKPGDRISVVFNPMSDGSHGGRLHTLVLLDTGLTLKTKLSDPGASELK
jgi:Family of unknown function (DUF6152)